MNEITELSFAGSPVHRFTGFQRHFPYHARVSSQAITTAPPSARTARNAPAAMLHTAERRHAHHMKRDTSSVLRPTTTTISAAVVMPFAG